MPAKEKIIFDELDLKLLNELPLISEVLTTTTNKIVRLFTPIYQNIFKICNSNIPKGWEIDKKQMENVVYPFSSIDGREKINSIERCDCSVIHEDIVNQVRDRMPQEENLYDLAELFKVFGDSTRIRILWALNESEMCVCDIAVLLDMTQSAISHQLRVLKQTNLVKNRREGKVVYYSLVDDHVRKIFDQGLIHINEE